MLTLESVQQQNYKDVEHIVVDGQSKDETLIVLAKYTKRCSNLRILSEKDTGIYNAINKGIAMANGEIIAILNAGDVYNQKEVLMHVAECFKQEAVDSVYGDLVYVKKNNYQRVVRYWESGPFERTNFYKGWMPPHPSFFVRKAIINKLGLYNESLSISSDYELMLRLLFKEGISTFYIPEVMVSMPEGGKSNKSLLNRLQANWEDRKAWKINELLPHSYTLFLKPFSKISQLFRRPKYLKLIEKKYMYEFFKESSIK